MIKNINVKFENPVYPDDDIIMNGKVVKIKEDDNTRLVNCEFNVKKPDAERVFSGS